MTPHHAVVLIGSPKLEKSTSQALGARLAGGLSARGVESETHFIHRALESPVKASALLDAVDRSDIVLFSFPLYVDQLPAPVIWACDRISERRKAARPGTRPLLAAIVQSGFPETHQNQTASDVMRSFAREAGFEWAGGLIMGMGGVVAGKPLPEKPRGMLKNTILALDRAAAALADGRVIPDDDLALMGRKLMGRGLYSAMGNFGMRHEIRKYARRSGKKLDPYARPFAVPETPKTD